MASAAGSALPLAGVVLAAAVVRIIALSAADVPRLTGDEHYYAHTAVAIASGRGHWSEPHQAAAGWPPGQSFALSLVVDPDARATGAHGVTTIRRFLRLEALLGTALVGAVGLLGWSLFDRRIGLLAAGLAALYPTFVAYSHYLWSETLFLLLSTLGLAAAGRAARTERLRWVAAAGVLLGLAALTREVGGVLAGAVALWWLASSRQGGAPARRAATLRSLLLLACAIATIAPWTIRNQLVLGRLVPVSTVGWMGVREGNTLGADWLRPDGERLRAFRARHFGVPIEIVRTDVARAEALELIRAEQPTWILKKAVRTSALLFSPDTFLFKKLSRGAYARGDGSAPPLAVVRAALALGVLAYLTVMTLAIGGILLDRDRRRRVLPLLVALAVVLLQLLANASSRYRLPLVPVAMVWAAFAALELRSGRRPSRREAMLWAAAAIALLAWPAVYFAPDAASLWNGGTYVVPNRP